MKSRTEATVTIEDLKRMSKSIRCRDLRIRTEKDEIDLGRLFNFFNVWPAFIIFYNVTTNQSVFCIFIDNLITPLYITQFIRDQRIQTT